METAIQPPAPQTSISLVSPSAHLIPLAALATKLGVSEASVCAVADAVVGSKTIRWAMSESPDKSVLALTLELQQCATQYTGCPKTDELVFDECVEFVITRFGFLNIMEIRSAFRLAASGELGEVKLEAYYGTFTVGMLGRVLSAYKEYRERLVEGVRLAEKRVEYDDAKVLKSTNWDSDAWLKSRRKRLFSDEGLSAADCTVYDFAIFEAEILAALSVEEKEPLWKDAWALALADYQDRAARGHYSARMVLREPVKDEGFRSVRIAWYRRLLVVAWAKKSTN